jgi:hypothetical protein
MRFLWILFVAAVWSIVSGSSFGDGLIFQLAPDGTWVRYATTTDGEATSKELPKMDLSMTGTLTVSSVGEVTRSQQKCRWIELKSETKAKDAYPKLVLKMLIPEDCARKGSDPLSHCVLTFFDPKPVDAKGIKSYIDEGFNRVQYEIDRFRDVFPPPLANSKSLPRETIETPAGKFEECEILVGTFDYDGPLLGDGRSVFKATYRTAVHPQAPFGVVRMQCEMEGREIHGDFSGSFKAKKTLTLEEIGKDAVSDLPEALQNKTKK